MAAPLASDHLVVRLPVAVETVLPVAVRRAHLLRVVVRQAPVADHAQIVGPVDRQVQIAHRPAAHLRVAAAVRR